MPPDALVLDADARRRHGVELRPQRPHDAPEQLLRAVEALDDAAQPSHGMRRELDRVRRADALRPRAVDGRQRRAEPRRVSDLVAYLRVVGDDDGVDALLMFR